MTPTPELPEVLRNYLKALPPDALSRVVEAAPWEWGIGLPVTFDGRRCLIGHAEDWRSWNPVEADGDFRDVAAYRVRCDGWFSVSQLFDGFVSTHGLDTARRLVQAEARRLLGK